MVKRGPFINVWGNPKIADDVRVGAYTEIGDDVEIESGVIIGAYVFIPPKVRIRARAWIGPRVTFLNDKYPPSPTLLETIVEEDVVIGAGAVILPGITLGRGCRVGAVAVVTKNVMPCATVVGNPARLLITSSVDDALDAMLQRAKEGDAKFLEALTHNEAE